MKSLLSVLIIGASLALPGRAGPTDSPDNKIRVLIVDGYSNHDWKLTTQLIRTLLESTGLFSVEVSTSPASSTAPAWDAWRPLFKAYDVVIQNYNDINGGPPWPRDVQVGFEDFVRDGGGVYIFHSAQNAFVDWPGYNEIIGLGWRKKTYGTAIAIGDDGTLNYQPPGEGDDTNHAPNGEVVIHLLGEHPIHDGLPQTWKTSHLEVYYDARGPAKNLRVLSYARDPRFGRNWPVEWTVNYGKGRAYIATFGHVWLGDVQPESMRCAGVQTMIVRAVQWLAHRPVTIPVPADFPTADRVSIRAEVRAGVTPSSPLQNKVPLTTP
jgi:type 1 glutamine amidotransferase